MDWIFQCNPKLYDLAAKLEEGTRTDDWAMNQHRELVSPGDRVFFWQTGPNARLVAVAHVSSPLYERESPFGRFHVAIAYDYEIVPPLTKPEALGHQALATIAPFKGAMGTNFPIQSAELVSDLDSVLEGRLVSFSASRASTAHIEDEQALDAAIKQARYKISKRIREHISNMNPIAFEWLIRALFLKLGYRNVNVTPPSGDGGVDLRATFVGGGIAKLRTCIQVKRQQSIGSPIVQSLRGSLSAHEAGLLVTSGQFTQGAVVEANDPHKLPITLINGGELVELLLTYQLGVRHVNLPMYRHNLDEMSFEQLQVLAEEPSVSGT